MKTKCTILVFTLLFAATMANAQPEKSTACNLRSDMRKLWEDHITWTRNVIFNILDDLPGTTQAVTRLLNNQVDIGNAIKPFYGNAAGEHLTALLHDHITLAADILTALKTNNTTAFNSANTQWYVNADSIARFLSILNPFWPYADMKEMMFDHLDLTAAEALARKNADYDADVIAYEKVHLEILSMADMLTEGIVKQFPNKFRGGPVTQASQKAEISSGSVVLKQNVPNPFTGQTLIAYSVPEDVRQAELVIYDNKGNLVKKVDLTARGEGSLTLYTSNLKKGLYSYSIIADGKRTAAKTMIH
jgi:hypothetical protein